MLLINPAFFSHLSVGGKYVINHQYLKRNHIKSFSSLAAREECVFTITKKETSLLSREDYVILLCHKPNCSHCVHSLWPLKITRGMLNTVGKSMVSSVGNLIAPVFEEVCHSCGVFSNEAWLSWSNHYICPSCMEQSASPPYPYGRGNTNCCNNYPCGSSLGQSDDSIYTLAISLQTAHEKTRKSS